MSKAISEIAYELGFKHPQHFSRFVNQGYCRLVTNPELMPGVLVSACKSEPEIKLVIVVTNENVISRKLELSLTGVDASSAAPCRTSATENLGSLPEFKIAENLLKVTSSPGRVSTFVVSVTPKQ